MDTDRELLELAAKAAGKEVFGWDKRGNPCVDPVDYVPWRPLTDDGDEARLEAELGLMVVWQRDFVFVGFASERYDAHGGDKQAARRRAGVIAAANIGKTMT